VAAPSISLSSGRGEKDEPLSPAKHAFEALRCASLSVRSTGAQKTRKSKSGATVDIFG